MSFKALKACVNGDGRPVQPPSKVLCRECFEVLKQQFEDLRASYGLGPALQKTDPAVTVERT